MVNQIAKLIIDQAEKRVKDIEDNPSSLRDDATRQIYTLMKQIIPVVKEQYGLNPYRLVDVIRSRGEDGMSATEIKEFLGMTPKHSNDFIYEDIIMKYPDHFGYKKVKGRLVIYARSDSDVWFYKNH